VPTLSETGLTGFHVASWNVILAPKGLPDDVRTTLSDAIVAAVKDPELQEKMRKLGVEPVGKASAEADTFFSQELQRWKQVIDAAGIKLER
jgi:tripartite-type tricarboxylate transporter receptor subunit TctC